MNKKSQLEELDVLQSIFLEDELQVVEKEFEKKIRLILWLYPLLPEGYIIKYKESLEDSDYTSITVNYLPPIEFFLKLPEGYPSETSPIFSIYCRWLTKEDTTKLTLQLEKIWSQNEKSEIIYNWADFLKNEALKFLGYDKELDLTLLYNYHLKHRKSKELESQDKQGSSEQGLVNREDQLFSCGIHQSGIPIENDKESYKDKVYSGFASLTNKVKKLTSWTGLVGGSSSNSGSSSSSSSGSSSSSSSSKSRQKPDQESETPTTHDRRSLYMAHLKASPVKLLITYNAERETMEFEKKIILCIICFTDFKGKDCFKFDKCKHAYCKVCMETYFATKINDSIHRIKCPETGCPSTATVEQVKGLVSEELFGKYDELLVQSALDTMGHIIYCPRTVCQYPATKDKEGNLGICPYCQFAFCVFCRMGYHGVEPCKLDDEEKKKLVQRYLNGAKEEKEMLESRYGKSQIETLVNNTLAETWIAENCKNCPKCNVSIEKSEGCNKMICWKCNTYFCWLCSNELERVNPYFHFNDPNSSCSNKLFFLTPLGDDDLDEYNSDDEQWRDWDWI